MSLSGISERKLLRVVVFCCYLPHVWKQLFDSIHAIFTLTFGGILRAFTFYTLLVQFWLISNNVIVGPVVFCERQILFEELRKNSRLFTKMHAGEIALYAMSVFAVFLVVAVVCYYRFCKKDSQSQRIVAGRARSYSGNMTTNYK